MSLCYLCLVEKKTKAHNCPKGTQEHVQYQDGTQVVSIHALNHRATSPLRQQLSTVICRGCAQTLKALCEPGTVVLASNLSTQKAEVDGSLEFEDGLVYIVGFRTA